ncbi:hypothetical protein PRABACTJOHN_02529 [Parabacteroides johnsonii DSM 18315]|uniref:Uncharacterized protein n=1 Tax=Parabacteroides johnsonii DSM 18315 TaxID=537006 RepID=B7BBW6_9BACT|nr:hypothetical protein PRABACTJOHN_02529 [Parabacteroides johnsonii DSM 18315]
MKQKFRPRKLKFQRQELFETLVSQKIFAETFLPVKAFPV